jgi:hypothetical protein
MKLFKFMTKETPSVEVNIGEEWVLTDDGSPWPNKHRLVARIQDVKDGWVKYSVGMFKDERMETKIFTKIYKKIER